MKIYFAGSIRGGRQDKDLYLEIVKKLAAFGTVLTEHVADPKLTSYGDARLSDAEIYERDVRWLSESDVVIAEVTTTSLGVGYELGLAESLQKKILCLYNEQRAQMRMPEKSAEDARRFSAMITGNHYMTVKFYKELDELDGILGEFLRVSGNELKKIKWNLTWLLEMLLLQGKQDPLNGGHIPWLVQEQSPLRWLFLFNNPLMIFLDCFNHVFVMLIQPVCGGPIVQRG